MAQQSSSAKFESTWGKFVTQQAARKTQSKLQAANIAPEKITLEVEDFQPPIRLENTEAIANLKIGALSGGVLGFLVGLSISLILTNFANEGLAVFSHWQTIHYLAPIMGAIVGAGGMSLISAMSGANIPQPNSSTNKRTKNKKHLVVVKGTAKEIDLAREIIARQGGVVEEADRR